MGQDKALLKLHSKTQLDYAFDLLTPVCGEVFVSLRPDQMPQGRPHIFDLPEVSNLGPLSGILSAMTLYPKVAWLVLACDLPFVTSETLTYLIAERDPGKIATAFISTHDQLPEPLCAIWEPQAAPVVQRLLQEGIQCPRKMLIKSHPRLIAQRDPHWLNNVNTPQELEQAKQSFFQGPPV